MSTQRDLMPMLRYLGDQLGQGRPICDLAEELHDDTSLVGRAYPAAVRKHLAECLVAQEQVRKRLGCEYKPSLLFKLDRIRGKGGDEWEVVNSLIVQAPTEKEARRLASLKAGGEGREVWLRPKKSTCVRLPDGEGSRVLLDQYVS